MWETGGDISTCLPHLVFLLELYNLENENDIPL
jgi:hypothetical protein